MSLVGKLEELPLADLLQIISGNEKSGRLSLTRYDGQGIIVFRRGRIIYAATNSARQTLGHLLLTESLIDERQLLEALERQHRAAEEKRLGTVLLELGSVSRDDLTRVVQRQIGEVIAEFLGWDGGYFKFDVMDLEDRGEIEVDVGDFLLEGGLTPDSVLLEFGGRLEALETAENDGSAPDEPGAALGSLRHLMAEIRSPEFTGEVGLKILDYAHRVLPRAVLFILRRGSFVGTGEHERLTVPVDQPSLLAEAANRKAITRGALEPIEWNLYLISQLGGVTPREAAALPLVVNHRVLLVLYGDDAGGGQPLPALAQLEVLMLQAGLAMEKRLLEKRVEQFERLRGAPEEA